jgi:hypothetical protein
MPCRGSCWTRWESRRGPPHPLDLRDAGRRQRRRAHRARRRSAAQHPVEDHRPIRAQHVDRRAQGSTSGYSRDLFPHWITTSGTCDTRETVLKRDGTSVVTSSTCAATSGRWYSPYDGATWTAASDIDIDLVVPLAEAWRSEAISWTTSKRQSYANDLIRPQLIAVTDNVNQSKGDQDPSTSQPSLNSYRCTYARMWIAVKYYWRLTLQPAEKTALQTMLNTCS